LKSLERGNVHEVTFMKSGKEISGFVTANPQFKTLDFYDRDLNPVYSKAVDLRKPLANEDKSAVQELVPETAEGVNEKTGRRR